jgi:ribonucleoside-triphosphate reductase
MKIVKRDGKIVEYDSNKIRVAIGKANAEVAEKERATEDQIENIIRHIEGLKKKRMLVEDVQDIIEEKLMELGKFELAKEYIVYRYTRALVRKSNTTDESILSLIKNSNKDLMEENSNKNAHIASTQRDLIAGEVSKDLTKRMLLPEKISKAHEDGVLHFHDADYFLQPIFNCCLINISDMLDNGTVMNAKLIESPKSFQVACTIMTQIIAAVASGQYGGQSVEVKHLGKYLRKSYDKFYKELEAYITSDKAYGMVVVGEDAIATMRGAIKQIRSDVPAMIGEEPRMTENVIHGSDCVESAENEIAIFNKLKKTNVR